MYTTGECGEGRLAGGEFCAIPYICLWVPWVGCEQAYEPTIGHDVGCVSARRVIVVNSVGVARWRVFV